MELGKKKAGIESVKKEKKILEKLALGKKVTVSLGVQRI